MLQRFNMEAAPGQAKNYSVMTICRARLGVCVAMIVTVADLTLISLAASGIPMLRLMVEALSVVCQLLNDCASHPRAVSALSVARLPTQVRHDQPVACLQRLDLIPPSIGGLGKTVQEDDRRTLYRV
jgi:hypothetical protein